MIFKFYKTIILFVAQQSAPVKDLIFAKAFGTCTFGLVCNMYYVEYINELCWVVVFKINVLEAGRLFLFVYTKC